MCSGKPLLHPLHPQASWSPSLGRQLWPPWALRPNARNWADAWTLLFLFTTYLGEDFTSAQKELPFSFLKKSIHIPYVDMQTYLIEFSLDKGSDTHSWNSWQQSYLAEVSRRIVKMVRKIRCLFINWLYISGAFHHHCPVELPVVMKICAFLCALQDSCHWPHVAPEHLKCGKCSQETKLVIFILSQT